MFNLLETEWEKLQEELRKRGSGNAYQIEQILKGIRHRVHEHDTQYGEWEKSHRDYEAKAADIHEEMKRQHYPTEDTRSLRAAPAAEVKRQKRQTKYQKASTTEARPANFANFGKKGVARPGD